MVSRTSRRPSTTLRRWRRCRTFFGNESCCKCFPCRIGTQRRTERLSGGAGPLDLSAWTEEVRDIGAAMRATSACGLGIAAPFVTDSLLKFFPEQVEKHTQRGRET